MTELLKKLRHRIAYWLASDWIDDLEYRLGAFLCEQTGGLLSKSNYTVEAMVCAANDYQQRLIDECELDAVKDFAERLKAKVTYFEYRLEDGDELFKAVELDAIDALVEEMVWRK